jgi:mitogen-activated protein kinase 6
VQIVAIRDIIPPAQRAAFNDVYIAYGLMDTDLHQIIRSNQALSEEHCEVLVSFNLRNALLLSCFHCTTSR